MQIMKFATHDDHTSHIGVVQGDQLIPIGHGERALSELLHASDPAATLQGLLASPQGPVAISSVRVLAPIDDQEVWGAGVTYELAAGLWARGRRSECGATRSGAYPSLSWLWC
jgi:2-dehydro-3-deoxy-D-arabinonate dehydratase